MRDKSNINLAQVLNAKRYVGRSQAPSNEHIHIMYVCKERTTNKQQTTTNKNKQQDKQQDKQKQTEQ